MKIRSHTFKKGEFTNTMKWKKNFFDTLFYQFMIINLFIMLLQLNYKSVFKSSLTTVKLNVQGVCNREKKDGQEYIAVLGLFMFE